MAVSIGRLAQRFGLSRSTLLYYDSIGLLTPSERTPANYRIYSDKDIRRMEQIAVYREAGLPLQTIGAMLDGVQSDESRCRYRCTLSGPPLFDRGW